MDAGDVVVAYKRDPDAVRFWERESRFPTKKEKGAKRKKRFGRGSLWKLPQLRKSIKGGLRHNLLMISTAA
jgi:hypothetical protein